jgi:glutamate dehydrogenase
MWFLKNLPQPMDIASVVRDYAGSAAQAIKSLETLLAELDVAALRGRQETLVGQGVPKDLAGRFAALPVMRSVCHVVHASNATRKSVESVGRIYFALGARLGLDWLRSAAERIEPRNHWERLAVSAIIEDLYGQQRGLASRVIQKGGKLDDGAIGKWVEANKASVERTSSLIDEFRLSGTVDLAQLAIVNRHVRSMLVS